MNASNFCKVDALLISRLWHICLHDKIYIGTDAVILWHACEQLVSTMGDEMPLYQHEYQLLSIIRFVVCFTLASWSVMLHLVIVSSKGERWTSALRIVITVSICCDRSPRPYESICV